MIPLISNNPTCALWLPLFCDYHLLVNSKALQEFSNWSFVLSVVNIIVALPWKILVSIWKKKKKNSMFCLVVYFVWIKIFANNFFSDVAILVVACPYFDKLLDVYPFPPSESSVKEIYKSQNRIPQSLLLQSTDSNNHPKYTPNSWFQSWPQGTP